MKRGMSSLIATVLLIGFGITLTIFIINWGRGFIESTQEDVEQQSREKFSCTTDVAFEIKCNCSKSEDNLDECTFQVINNEDSIINKISYRLFRGDKFIVSDTESLEGLEPWDVSNYFIINDPKLQDIQADNIKLEVLATEIDTRGTIINCADLASNIGNCRIEE